jgi:hypothetical protein
MLFCTIKSFSCVKAGNSVNENEDALLAPFDSFEGEIRVAVADGATESSFSLEWANLLVNYYKDSPNFETDFFTLFPEIKESWLDRIDYSNLEWYAQQKLEMGAFASLLGADINLLTGSVKVIAVGDSNFFAFRNGKMIKAFPIERSEDFGNTPILISTELHKNKTDNDFFKTESFEIVAGDVLIAATDAISQWILKCIENGNYPITDLIGLPNTKSDPYPFQNWLNELRKLLLIRNDDTTLVLIQIF